MRRDREQQRAGSSHHYAFAGNRQSSAHHRVKAADAHHIGQRPAWKWQEPLARAGGQNELIVSKVAAAAIPFRAQHTRARSIDNTPTLKPHNRRCGEPFKPGAGRSGLSSATAPNLSARSGIVVHQPHALSRGSRCYRRGNAGRSRAHHQDVQALDHVVRTSMPSAQSTWQLR